MNEGCQSWRVEKSRTIGQLACNAFRGTGAGTIIGVFQHGWYLDNSSAVLMLHNSLAGEIPFGVGIAKFEEKLPYRKEFEGKYFLWRNSSLVFPSMELVIDLQTPVRHSIIRETDIRRLKTTQTCIRELLRDYGRGYLKTLLEEKSLGLGKMADKKDIIGYYEVRSEEKICDFLTALFANDKERMREKLRVLIGFGQGLTPALDDWLSGFIYTLQRVWVDETMEEQVLVLRREITEIALENTNRISATYLRSIAQGYYFELLENAMHAFAEEDVRPLLCIGNSSGSDMLTGISCAISYVEKYAERR